MTPTSRPSGPVSGSSDFPGEKILIGLLRIASIPLFLIALLVMTTVYLVGLGFYGVFCLLGDCLIKPSKTRQAYDQR